MKTTNIKGKPYVEVHERIKYFRENYKGYRLTSDIVSINEGVCIIQANIHDDKGDLVATGIAYEKEGSTFINKTSYIENCETSAWGRALANLGIGIDAGIASADEVVKEPELPKPTKKQWDGILKKFKTGEINTDQVTENFSLSDEQLKELV